MSSRIICLEEHCTFPELLKSAQGATTRLAPYYEDFNSRHRDDPDSPGTLPALSPVKDAIAMAGAPVSGRLSAMDDNGIDMQVLSYTEMIQLLPPDKAMGLAQKANKFLAEQAERYPDRFRAFCTLPW